MYAGAPYAGAPYAGGASTTTTTTPDYASEAPLLLVADGVYVEQDFPAPLPAVGAHSYVVALVYPTPDLVAGRPT